MFPQIAASPLTAGAAGPALAKAPAAAPPPQPIAAPRPSARHGHWRAAAFSMFADDQADGSFSLWPRDTAVKAPKAPSAASKKKAAKPAAPEPEDRDGAPARPQKMHFRSALEQVRDRGGCQAAGPQRGAAARGMRSWGVVVADRSPTSWRSPVLTMHSPASSSSSPASPRLSIVQVSYYTNEVNFRSE